MFFVSENTLLKKIVKSALNDEVYIKTDMAMVKDAEAIIERLNSDYRSIVRIAKRKGINTKKIDLSTEAGRLNPEQEFRLHLNHLNEYLSLLPEEQQIILLPRQISNLISASHDLKLLGLKSKILDQLIDKYKNEASDYDKRLKVQGLRLNFLRVNDYQLLEEVRRFVYLEATFDDQLYFLVDNNNLLDDYRSRSFDANELRNANNKTSDYLNSIQRLNNYLVNELEHVSWYEKLGTWLLTHFAPTLLSLLLIILIWAVLWVFGVKLDPNILIDHLKI